MNPPIEVPMTLIVAILCLVGGVFLGWLITRRTETSTQKQEEINRILEQKLSASAAHEAELSARLEALGVSSKEQHSSLEAQIQNQAAELQSLREKLTAVTAKEAEASGRLQSEQLAARGLQTTLETQIREQESELKSLRSQVNNLTAEKTELATKSEAERSAVEEKLQLLQDAERKLTDAFKAISADALSKNNQSFLDLAKSKLAEVETAVRGDFEKRQQAISELVTPMRTSLEKVDEKIQHLERVREGAYSELREQVRNLGEGQTRLRSETSKLVTALRAPAVRGRWGEIQLQRVVEMAGMVEHCDFLTQPTVEGDDGRLRPDLIVRLPGGKSIVVDAKAPLSAYLTAMDESDEGARKALMQNHASQVRTHLQSLGRKSYAAQFQPAPDFVVLFLPGESFFSAALENDPTLIEFGLDQNVVLATPTTLIALLRTASYGWQQEALAKNAAEISELGKVLHSRISGLAQLWTKVGVNLGRAIHAYNSASASLESRVLVTARKFEDLKATPVGLDIKTVIPVERTVRTVGDLSAPVDVDDPMIEAAEPKPPVNHSIGAPDSPTPEVQSDTDSDTDSDQVSVEESTPPPAHAKVPWWQQESLQDDDVE